MKIEEKKLVLGLLFIPAYLLQQSILLRSVQFFIIVTLYILQGSKFKIIPNLILIFGITLAYVIRPVGKVLFMLFEFPITEGALISGLTKSFMIIGIIYISRLSVSSKLILKGTLGNLVARVFYYFEAITENKCDFRFKNFYKRGAKEILITYMDNLLFMLENMDRGIGQITKNKDSKFFLPTIISLLVFIIASYIMILPNF